MNETFNRCLAQGRLTQSTLQHAHKCIININHTDNMQGWKTGSMTGKMVNEMNTEGERDRDEMRR